MKSKTQGRIIDGIFTFLACILLTLFFGYLLFRGEIFHQNRPAFQFLSSGLLGSVLIASVTVIRARDYWFLFGILIILHGIIVGVPEMDYFIRMVLYQLTYALAIFFYGRLHLKSSPKPALNRFFSLAGLVCTAQLVLVIILNIIYKKPDFINHFRIQIFFAFMISLGLGLGYELGRILIRSIRRA
jgi:hypothetical protein